jgi:hypothetical protein
MAQRTSMDRILVAITAVIDRKINVKEVFPLMIESIMESLITKGIEPAQAAGILYMIQVACGNSSQRPIKKNMMIKGKLQATALSEISTHCLVQTKSDGDPPLRLRMNPTRGFSTCEVIYEKTRLSGKGLDPEMIPEKEIMSGLKKDYEKRLKQWDSKASKK